ncbi:MAG: DtxR family Mn-dependent transcriptional regulator [Bradymonadia bacterium]|jgi:DtxR family Mn-dependent transcriptional regulator
MPSSSIEDYLKAIYHLSQASQQVKTKAIAERMDVSSPSVTAMLRTLSGLGYVDYEAYRGASLTEPGTHAALRVIRNHRLLEAFLVRTLGYGWDEVHAEAERLEHAVSDNLIDRIDAFLSHPAFDPHGDPIPKADGRLPLRRAEPLPAFDHGTHVRVVRVLDQDPAVLRHLNTLGLVPGTEVTVLGPDPFGGPFRVRHDGADVLLGQELALRVMATNELATDSLS